MGSRRRRSKAVSSGSIGSGKLAIVLIGLVLVNLYVFLWRDDTSIPDVAEAAIGNKPVAGNTDTAPESDTSEALESATESDDESEITVKTSLAQAPADSLETGEVPIHAANQQHSGEVAAGDSLGQIFAREGLNVDEQQLLLRSLKSHLDFRAIRPGQKYDISVVDGKATSFTFHLGRVKKVKATRSGDTWTVIRTTAATEAERVEFGGRIDDSLYHALKARGEDTSLIALLVDMFDYDVNFFTDQHPGDEFRVIVEKRYVNGKFHRYGRILAAEYRGKVGTFRAYSWRVPGTKRFRYFSEDGKSIETTFLKTPLKFTRVSSRFNRRRMHPVLHRVRAHLGTDFAAPTGTPVRAAASGKIVRRGWCGGGGNCVKIQHQNGIMTVYFHLSRHAKGQKAGQYVHQKDVIGFVGATGTATGPHLHFEVRKNGRAIDPMTMKMTRLPGVPKDKLTEYQTFAEPLKNRLSEIAVD